jgi:hypothetical protein
MAGGHINGHAALEGTMIGPSLFSGRVAGHAMAADLGLAARQSAPWSQAADDAACAADGKVAKPLAAAATGVDRCG